MNNGKFDKTLSELFTNYMLAESTTACSPSRYGHKKNNLIKFVEFIGKNTLVYQITEEQSRTFCEDMAKKHTLNTYLQVVRDVVRMFSYALRHKYIVASPMTFELMYDVQEKMYDNDTLENTVCIDKRQLDKLISDVVYNALEFESKMKDLVEN